MRFHPSGLAGSSPQPRLSSRPCDAKPSWHPPGQVDIYAISRQTLGADWVYLARELDHYLQTKGTVALESLVENRNGRGSAPWTALVDRARDAMALRVRRAGA